MRYFNPPHYIYIYSTAMNQLILINSYLVSKTLKREVIVFLKEKWSRNSNGNQHWCQSDKVKRRFEVWCKTEYLQYSSSFSQPSSKMITLSFFSGFWSQVFNHIQPTGFQIVWLRDINAFLPPWILASDWKTYGDERYEVNNLLWTRSFPVSAWPLKTT